MKTRIVTGIMVIALALTAIMPAYALEPNVYEEYQHDGITYFNIKDAPLNSAMVFYRQLLGTRREELGGYSMAECWLLLAACMENNHSVAHGISRAKQFELAQGAIGKKSDPYASLSNDAGAWYPGGGGLYSQMDAFRWVTNNGTPYLELRMRILNYYDIVVIFTSPSLLALFPDASVKNNYVSTSEVKNTPGEVDDQKSLWNRSSNTTTRNNTSWTEAKSSSLTNTIEASRSGSSEYSFTEGIEVGVKADVSVAEISTKVNFSASQAFTEGWSSTQSETKGQTDSTGDTVEFTQDLPAWSAILLSKFDSILTKTMKYNCPMGVRFFYTAFAQNSDGSNQQAFAWFGQDNLDAQQELYKRAYQDGVIDGIDRGGITWSTIRNTQNFAAILNYCATKRPVSAQEATIVINRKTQTYQNDGMFPIRPLKYVRIEGDTTKTMSIGDSESTISINIKGYNDMNTEYVTFNALAGNWIVTDANGKVLDANTAPVKIITDSSGKNARYSAVRTGTCYLKYIIDENVYGTAENMNYKTKNSDLSSTAMLAITVVSNTNAAAKQYTITGDFLGVANSTAEAIYGDGKLEVMVKDETGVELDDTNYYWQAQEKASSGISITRDGMVRFTKAGRFHVRVVNNENATNFSAWKTISVEYYGLDENGTAPIVDELVESAEGAMFYISGNYTGGVENDPENIEGTGKLSVEAYDSTGKEINLAYAWESESSSGIELAEDGTVSFTQIGTYRVRVRNGDTYSEWHSITANEFAPARVIGGVPSPTYNLYKGSAIPIINETRAENGTMVYALGVNDTTVPALEAFSEELPMATDVGTYYVWYMAAGDERHTNSEPECVVVKIVNKPEEFGVTFEIDGYFAADADGQARSIEGEDKLTVKVYDVFFEVETEVSYVWEFAEDYGTDAVLTSDGIVTFNKAGTYYVRVRYGDSVSDSVAIYGAEYVSASESRSPGSSISGCDVGFGFMGMMLSMLILRRKAR